MTPEHVILHERAALYDLLRQLYDYPLRPALLEPLLALDVPSDSPLAEGLREMQGYLEDRGTGEGSLEALLVEMTHLFEGPGRPAAPPYASYYLHGGLLMGPPAGAARQIYLDWLLAPAGETHLPDDHIAVELSFLAHLAHEAAVTSDPEGVRTMLATSQTFLQQHVQPWLPRFAKAVRSASHSRFFNGLVTFTEQVIKADLAWIAGVVDDMVITAGLETPVT